MITEKYRNKFDESVFSTVEELFKKLERETIPFTFEMSFIEAEQLGWNRQSASASIQERAKIICKEYLNSRQIDDQYYISKSSCTEDKTRGVYVIGITLKKVVKNTLDELQDIL